MPEVLCQEARICVPEQMWYLQNDRFQGLVSGLPKELQQRAPLCFLAQLFSRLLLKKWIPEFYRGVVAGAKDGKDSQRKSKTFIDYTTQNARSKEVNSAILRTRNQTEGQTGPSTGEIKGT
jgi:hypothetical protein